jgi:hypothetical protein
LAFLQDCNQAALMRVGSTFILGCTVTLIAFVARRESDVSAPCTRIYDAVYDEMKLKQTSLT